MRIFSLVIGIVIWGILSGCTAGTESRSVIRPPQAPTTPPPTPAPTPLPQTPTPSPTPPAKPQPIDREAVMDEVEKALSTSIVQSWAIISPMADEELPQQFSECTVTPQGPPCLNLDTTQYQGYLFTDTMTYASHFAVSTGVESKHFILSLQITDSNPITLSEFTIHAVDTSIEELTSAADIDRLHTRHSSYNLYADTLDGISSRLKDEPNLVIDHHTMELIDRVANHSMSEALKDQLIQILFFRRPIFAIGDADYTLALSEFLTDTLGAAGDRLHAIADQMVTHTDLTVRQLAACMLLTREPDSKQHRNHAMEALHQDNAYLQMQAIKALGPLELSKSQIGEILKMIGDEKEPVARAAYEFAKTVDFERSHYTVLEEVIQSNCRKCREFVIFLLGNQPTKSSAGVLARHLNDDDVELSRHIFNHLESMSGNPELLGAYPRTLIGHFEDTRPVIRLHVAKILRYLPSRRSLDAIINQINVEAGLRAPYTSLELQIALQESERLIRESLAAPD